MIAEIITAVTLGVAALSPVEVPPDEFDHPQRVEKQWELLRVQAGLPARPAEPEPEPEPVPEPHVHDTVWDRLAQCESNGDWHINTGNGYYGGIQFSERSWRWVGGSGYPHEHSREEQIRRAEILLERQGWVAWPACSKKLGLR